MRHLPLILLLLSVLSPLEEARGQSFIERIPEVLVPEPHGQIPTKVGASRVPITLQDEDLPELLSPDLSTACSQLLFNQVQQGKLFVVIPYEVGPPRRFGYATGTGRNLNDPSGLRQPGRVYLFQRDGTSDCRVYDAPQQF